jgi:hypothetical protein
VSNLNADLLDGRSASSLVSNSTYRSGQGQERAGVVQSGGKVLTQSCPNGDRPAATAWAGASSCRAHHDRDLECPPGTPQPGRARPLCHAVRCAASQTAHGVPHEQHRVGLALNGPPNRQKSRSHTHDGSLSPRRGLVAHPCSPAPDGQSQCTVSRQQVPHGPQSTVLPQLSLTGPHRS